MSEIERRAANRRRAAERYGAADPPPGFDGAEAIATARLVGPISCQQGRTEYKGGWSTAKMKLGKGAR